MDKTIRTFTSFEAMKAEEYLDWQARLAHERMRAVSEITQISLRRSWQREGRRI